MRPLFGDLELSVPGTGARDPVAWLMRICASLRRTRIEEVHLGVEDIVSSTPASFKEESTTHKWTMHGTGPDALETWADASNGVFAVLTAIKREARLADDATRKALLSSAASIREAHVSSSKERGAIVDLVRGLPLPDQTKSAMAECFRSRRFDAGPVWRKVPVRSLDFPQQLTFRCSDTNAQERVYYFDDSREFNDAFDRAVKWKKRPVQMSANLALQYAACEALRRPKAHILERCPAEIADPSRPGLLQDEAHALYTAQPSDYPGKQIEVRLDRGETIAVVVPDGCLPGMQIRVPIPTSSFRVHARCSSAPPVELSPQNAASNGFAFAPAPRADAPAEYFDRERKHTPSSSGASFFAPPGGQYAPARDFICRDATEFGRRFEEVGATADAVPLPNLLIKPGMRAPVTEPDGRAIYMLGRRDTSVEYNEHTVVVDGGRYFRALSSPRLVDDIVLSAQESAVVRNCVDEEERGTLAGAPVSGEHWVEIGEAEFRRKEKHAIRNDALERALRRDTLSFARTDLAQLGVGKLTCSSVVAAHGKFYKPVKLLSEHRFAGPSGVYKCSPGLPNMPHVSEVGVFELTEDLGKEYAKAGGAATVLLPGLGVGAAVIGGIVGVLINGVGDKVHVDRHVYVRMGTPIGTMVKLLKTAWIYTKLVPRLLPAHRKRLLAHDKDAVQKMLMENVLTQCLFCYARLQQHGRIMLMLNARKVKLVAAEAGNFDYGALGAVENLGVRVVLEPTYCSSMSFRLVASRAGDADAEVIDADRGVQLEIRPRIKHRDLYEGPEEKYTWFLAATAAVIAAVVIAYFTGIPALTAAASSLGEAAVAAQGYLATYLSDNAAQLALSFASGLVNGLVGQDVPGGKPGEMVKVDVGGAVGDLGKALIGQESEAKKAKLIELNSLNVGKTLAYQLAQCLPKWVLGYDKTDIPRFTAALQESVMDGKPFAFPPRALGPVAKAAVRSGAAQAGGSGGEGAPGDGAVEGAEAEAQLVQAVVHRKIREDPRKVFDGDPFHYNALGIFDRIKQAVNRHFTPAKFKGVARASEYSAGVVLQNWYQPGYDLLFITNQMLFFRNYDQVLRAMQSRNKFMVGFFVGREVFPSLSVDMEYSTDTTLSIADTSMLFHIQSGDATAEYDASQRVSGGSAALRQMSRYPRVGLMDFIAKFVVRGFTALDKTVLVGHEVSGFLNTIDLVCRPDHTVTMSPLALVKRRPKTWAASRGALQSIQSYVRMGRQREHSIHQTKECKLFCQAVCSQLHNGDIALALAMMERLPEFEFTGYSDMARAYHHRTEEYAYYRMRIPRDPSPWDTLHQIDAMMTGRACGARQVLARILHALSLRALSKSDAKALAIRALATCDHDDGAANALRLLTDSIDTAEPYPVTSQVLLQLNAEKRERLEPKRTFDTVVSSEHEQQLVVQLVLSRYYDSGECPFFLRVCGMSRVPRSIPMLVLEHFETHLDDPYPLFGKLIDYYKAANMTPPTFEEILENVLLQVTIAVEFLQTKLKGMHNRLTPKHVLLKLVDNTPFGRRGRTISDVTEFSSRHCVLPNIGIVAKLDGFSRSNMTVTTRGGEQLQFITTVSKKASEMISYLEDPTAVMAVIDSFTQFWLGKDDPTLDDMRRTFRTELLRGSDNRLDGSADLTQLIQSLTLNPAFAQHPFVQTYHEYEFDKRVQKIRAGAAAWFKTHSLWERDPRSGNGELLLHRLRSLDAPTYENLVSAALSDLDNVADASPSAADIRSRFDEWYARLRQSAPYPHSDDQVFAWLNSTCAEHKWTHLRYTLEEGPLVRISLGVEWIRLSVREDAVHVENALRPERSAVLARGSRAKLRSVFPRLDELKARVEANVVDSEEIFHFVTNNAKKVLLSEAERSGSGANRMQVVSCLLASSAVPRPLLARFADKKDIAGIFVTCESAFRSTAASNLVSYDQLTEVSASAYAEEAKKGRPIFGSITLARSDPSSETEVFEPKLPMPEREKPARYIEVVHHEAKEGTPEKWVVRRVSKGGCALPLVRYNMRVRLGHRWVKVEQKRAEAGTEYTNEGLSEALKAALVFSDGDLDKWGVDPDLGANAFVRARVDGQDSYFIPDVLENKRCGEDDAGASLYPSVDAPQGGGGDDLDVGDYGIWYRDMYYYNCRVHPMTYQLEGLMKGFHKNLQMARTPNAVELVAHDLLYIKAYRTGEPWKQKPRETVIFKNKLVQEVVLQHISDVPAKMVASDQRMTEASFVASAFEYISAADFAKDIDKEIIAKAVTGAAGTTTPTEFLNHLAGRPDSMLRLKSKGAEPGAPVAAVGTPASVPAVPVGTPEYVPASATPAPLTKQPRVPKAQGGAIPKRSTSRPRLKSVSSFEAAMKGMFARGSPLGSEDEA